MHLLRAYEALTKGDSAIYVVLALLLNYLLELVTYELRAGEADGSATTKIRD